MRWHIDAVTAPFKYEEPLARELVALKRAGGRQLGRALGLCLAEALGAAGADVAVPVPLHPSRLRERGFNQAVEIARVIGRASRVRVRAHGAARTRATRLQPGLDPAGRAANLEGAFRAVGRYDGMRVAIVDDVMTTGATVNALAKTLRESGAVGVEAWTVARARPG